MSIRFLRLQIIALLSSSLLLFYCGSVSADNFQLRLPFEPYAGAALENEETPPSTPETPNPTPDPGAWEQFATDYNLEFTPDWQNITWTNSYRNQNVTSFPVEGFPAPIVDRLWLAGFPLVTSISSLSTITQAGDVLIGDFPSLQSLDGLQNLTSVGALRIDGGNGFTTLQGLSGLKRIEGIFRISNGSTLTSLDGLTSLEYIEELEITSMALEQLANVDALANISVNTAKVSSVLGGYYYQGTKLPASSVFCSQTFFYGDRFGVKGYMCELE